MREMGKTKKKEVYCESINISSNMMGGIKYPLTFSTS